MTAKDKAKKELDDLISYFQRNEKALEKGGSNEDEVVRHYISPMFKALGWDFNNDKRKDLNKMEVRAQITFKANNKDYRPDFNFNYENGSVAFYLDAKAVPVKLDRHIDSALQVRGYGWNAKRPICVLTDFQEFAVYNCTVEPKKTDSVKVGLIKYLKYDEYLENQNFDFLWSYFYKENVQNDSLEELIKTDGYIKGGITVDKHFLITLNRWRELLALGIHKSNSNIDSATLNYAVQQTIDRILFLRICEARNIETSKKLFLKIAGVQNAYDNLLTYYFEANNRYNSGLFDFKKDTVSTHIKIDDFTLSTIINELYQPPYRFDVMPVEIIGNAYEQFLGNEIRVERNKIIIEQKPEVRKAGGVYYTPQYIVNYIVEKTVGQLIAGKTPDQIAKIKIVDPSCGSGSFLLGAYQFLLDYHLDYYYKNRKKLKEIPVGDDGKLTTIEKKRILNNNIFGVDLDERAVEIAKLSLLLKVLEDETSATLEDERLLGFKEKVLPNLDMNIQCGNSLIGKDLRKRVPSVSIAEEKGYKVFDWATIFPKVFQQGGFDCVIGNPPYGASLTGIFDFYFRDVYAVAGYQLDTYILFIERATQLIKEGGLIGYIIPSAWVASMYDVKLRQFLAQRVAIDGMVITPKKTFEDATVETCILLLSKKSPKNDFFVERWDSSDKYAYDVTLKDILSNPNFNFPVYSNQDATRLIKKMQLLDMKLSDFANVVWGAKIYEKGKGLPPQKGFESETKIYHSDKKTKPTHRPLLGGSEINRYALNWKGGFIDYGSWLAAPRKPEWFEGKRIVVREVTAKGVIQATIIDGDYVFSNSVDGIKMTSKDMAIEFLLGVLNSKLISFYHSNTSANAFKGTFPKVLLQDLRDLPLPTMDKENKAIHDKIVNLVKEMMQLKTDILKTPIDKRDAIHKSIVRKDESIDELVYQIYGLTKGDIALIG
ncbi:MAG: N-6 DNA methylase [Saprospiraceae bacterium]|nr:N-6 DNA methylase [Saprospiraceae bacterium]